MKSKRRHLPSQRKSFSDWPVEFWIPSRGWIPWSCLTFTDQAEAIKFADRHGDRDQPVSRWRNGLVSATLANASALAEFPPGPRDDPMMYPVVAEAVQRGWITPTHDFQRGQRKFRSLIYRGDPN
jgi:hypothetical protein